jgi:hypothetical protein
MIGRDGRVVVLDFGLVRELDEQARLQTNAEARALGVVDPLANLRASHPELVIDKGLDTAFAEAARKAT